MHDHWRFSWRGTGDGPPLRKAGVECRRARAGATRGRERLRRNSAASEFRPCRCDVADSPRSSAAADESCAQWGEIDIWVNDAMASVFGPLEDDGRRVPARHRGQLSRASARNNGGAAPHEPRNGGMHHPDWLGAGLSLHPPSERLLRGKGAVRGFTDSLRSELIHAEQRQSASRWCNCRPSTRRSSTGHETICRGACSQCRPYTSLKR